MQLQLAFLTALFQGCTSKQVPSDRKKQREMWIKEKDERGRFYLPTFTLRLVQVMLSGSRTSVSSQLSHPYHNGTSVVQQLRVLD